jgi:outer membrane protein
MLPVSGLSMRTLYHSQSPLPQALKRAARTGAALGLFLPLLAASAGEGGESSAWGLGIGAISAQKAYAGADRENRALPLIYYENRWVRVLGPVAEVKLPRLGISDSQHIDFRLVARYDGSGYEADDAPILEGMAKRKSGFWAGGKAIWHNDIANLGAEWTTDATGHSKGQRFSLSLEKNWRLGQHVMLAPRLGATWYDKKYVDYYFGVRAGEAATGRAAYSGRAGVNTELSVRGTYLVDSHNSVFLDVGVTRLAQEIKDSPLVGRSTENRVFVGYLYRF